LSVCHGRWGRFSALLCLSIAFGPIAPFGSFSAAAATPSPAATVAARIWDKLLTKCGPSYFYGGSVFDRSGMLGDVTAGDTSVMEFRGVRFNAVPMRVTDAERANGVESRARITMIAHLYRENGESWTDGPDLQPRNTDDILGQALGQANGDMLSMGNSGAMALDLIRFKGAWAVARSSITLSGPLGFDAKYYDVDKVIAAKVARYDCEAGQVVAPKLSDEEIHHNLDEQMRAHGRTPEQIAAYWQAAAKLKQDAIIIRDSRMGVPFVPVSEDQLEELKSYYDERGFSRDVMKRLDNGMVQPAEFYAFQQLIDRYPVKATEGQWLAPGTSYVPVCKVTSGDFCADVYWSNALRFANKNFVIIKVTSGPQIGQLAMIEMGNYDPSIRVICPPQYPNLRC